MSPASRFDHRRAWPQGRAHGPPRHGGLPPCQWCGEIAQQTGEDPALPRFRCPLAGEVHQCHQRRHATTLGGPRQSPALGADHEAIGEGWIRDFSRSQELERFADDAGFLERWGATKLAVKHHLAHYIHRHTGVLVDPASMFDVQVKRIHEYKRQHLNALQVIALYLRIKNGTAEGEAPRTVIFGGKAAPGYYMAKLIIRFLNAIAETVNADPDMQGRLRVIFLPNYNVKLGERCIQPPTFPSRSPPPGKEASGTGNMKFAMNGALTIGTLDGANVEIREHVGAANFFLFGKTTEELAALHERGLPALGAGERHCRTARGAAPGGAGPLQQRRHRPVPPLLQNLTGRDPFFVLADFDAYLKAQAAVSRPGLIRDGWNRMALLNSGPQRLFLFGSLRGEYAERIWRARVSGHDHGDQL